MEVKMKEVYDFLEKTEVNYVSTINGNEPSCRPFGVPVVYDNKIYVLTSKDKNVSKQICQNNNVCIVAYDKEKWLRLNCKLIDDSNNLKVKQLFLDMFPSLIEVGYGLDNPNMQVLYIDEAKATIYDEDGEELAEYYF
jgi:uncharacterized pyridoxamine 5'-phosphate oxidase family protein